MTDPNEATPAKAETTTMKYLVPCYTVGMCDSCEHPLEQYLWDYMGDLLCEDCCAIAWEDDDNDDLMEEE